MDLKEFITETISAISDATSELQEKYSSQGILINPPSAQSGKEVYQPGSSNYTFRRVQNIAFDVAVAAGTEVGGQGKVGIRVLSLEISGEGGKQISTEQVSRVCFTVPITLKPTEDETVNAKKRDRENVEFASNPSQASYDFDPLA